MTTLELFGVPKPNISPDAPPQVMGEEPMIPPGATVLTAEAPIRTAASRLRLILQLPPGYHLTKGAKSRFEAGAYGSQTGMPLPSSAIPPSISDEAPLVNWLLQLLRVPLAAMCAPTNSIYRRAALVHNACAHIVDAGVKLQPTSGLLPEDRASLPVDIQVMLPSSGQVSLVMVVAKVYFCQDEDVCLFEEVVFRVPVGEVVSGSESTIDLSYSLSPKQLFLGKGV